MKKDHFRNQLHTISGCSNVFITTTDGFTLYTEKNKRSPVSRASTKNTLKHGDMIYLVPDQENLFPTEVTSSPHVPLDFKSDTPTNGTSYASPKIGSFQSNSIGKMNVGSTDVKEDDVDVQLDKIDGRIPRKRDPQLYETDVFREKLIFLLSLSV